MATKKLTDLTELSEVNITQDDLFYVVDPSDQTQDPSGSSFKATLGNISIAVGNIYGGVANGLATLDGGAKLKAAQIPNVGVVNSFNGRDGTVFPVAGDYEASQIQYDSPSNTPVYTESKSALDRLLRYISTSGQVKVNGYGASLKPTQTLTTNLANTLFGPFQFNYGPSLIFSSSPTNQFPEMDQNKDDSSIWDNTNLKFKENNSLGQSNLWRFIFSYSRNTASKVQVIIRLRNPVSGFKVSKRIYFSEEISGTPDAGVETIDLITIADNASIPDGEGYFLEALIYGDNNASIDFTLESTTRISLANFNTATV